MIFHVKIDFFFLKINILPIYYGITIYLKNTMSDFKQFCAKMELKEHTF